MAYRAEKRVAAATSIYRGSTKHKNRPANEQKGTLCPEWTHVTPAGGVGTDVYAHDWAATPAAALFGNAVVEPSNGRRYATAHGIAFEAKNTKDGTWHGYPIPWEDVPAAIKDKWQASNAVSARDLKKSRKFDPNDIFWAIKADLR